tara:strand:+ start:1310 stop:1768 length:459 start_codon:yes stop_codon:yes gene_type:complete
MKIVIGADHGGFELKNSLKKFLEEKGYEVDDKGPETLDPEDDYPDYGKKVAEKVGKSGNEIGQKNVMGILICRSAAGIIITANKFKGVRGVAVFDETQAKHSREHNDANVLGLSGDWTKEKQAEKIVKIWLETPYSDEERHTRRLKKIADME